MLKKLKVGVENMDVKEINRYGQELVECLKLKTSPVAVKLIPKGGEVPEGNRKSRRGYEALPAG